MLSIIIPAYNEEKSIGKCLEALLKQNTTRKFEIILVDNASTDKTAEVAEQFKEKLNLKIVKEERKGRGIARKVGFENASGNIFLSTDADTIVPSNWVEKLTNTLEGRGAVAVTGTCKIVDCSPLTNLLFNTFMSSFMRGYRLLIGHYWLSGFSFATYKDAYEKSGGFSGELTAQEDIDLSFRVQKIGKIQIVTDVPVIFSGRRFQKGIVHGLVPYMSTFAEYYLFKKKNVVLPDIR